MELITYHYTEIDNVFIPVNTDTHVYLVGDEEGPELHVYLQGATNAKEKTEVPESDICSA